jgi:hypothetical protein
VILPITSSEAVTLWNDFTKSRPSVSPISFNPTLFFFYDYHFGWKSYYFFLYRKDDLIGLLPLVNTGKAWVSLPHFSYGGFLFSKDFIKNGFPDSNISSLINYIKCKNVPHGFYRLDIDKISKKDCIEKIYVRTLEPTLNLTNSVKVVSWIHLPNNLNDAFYQLSPNLRRKINKAGKYGFRVMSGKNELLHDFYRVYAKNIHGLGSPVYGEKFFRDLIEHYKYGNAFYVIIYKDSLPVASAVLLSYNGFWENTWFATDKKFRKYYISDFLHWQMIKLALKNKAEIYSYGRSTNNSSVFKYKNHWPVSNVSVMEYYENYKIFLKNHVWLSELWKRIPFPVARIIGQKLIKHIY